MTDQVIEVGRMVRSAQITRAGEADEDDRSVEVSFSSEIEVRRWFGVEVLGHGEGEIDLTRLNTGRAPLLKDHRNSVDAKVGSISRAWVADGKGRAVLNFSETDEGSAMLARVRSGDLTEISVGYDIERLVLHEEREGEDNIYRATRWSPHEISLVAAPADTSVGVGRSQTDNVRTFTFKTEKGATMAKENEAAPTGEDLAVRAANVTAAEEQLKRDREALENERAADKAKADNEKRMTEIREIGAAHNMPKDFIENACRAEDITVDRFNGLVLKELGAERTAEIGARQSAVGLTDNQIDNFSVVRLLNALINPQDVELRDAAGMELEACAAAKAKRGGTVKGTALPSEVISATRYQGQRLVQVGVDADGGATVETAIGGMIGLLRNASVLWARATPLGNMVGNIDLPRMLSSGAAAWLAEHAQSPELTPGWDDVQLRPWTIGGHTVLTRQMLLQSSFDMELLTRQNLVSVIALQTDRKAMYGVGAGSNEPLGVSNTTGVGAVNFAGATPTRAEIISLETAVRTGNAMRGALFYAFNGAMAGLLQNVPVDAGSGRFVLEGDQVNRRDTAVSEQFASGDVLFGNGKDAIAATWGQIDILPDPYSLSDRGGVKVSAFATADYAVQHPASFAVGETP